MSTRVDNVEGLGSILDGRGVPGYGGILGKLGEFTAELREIHKDITGLRDDFKTLDEKVDGIQTVTGKIDGQTEPPSRGERVLTTLIPVLVALVTALGGVAGAYFLFKGQVTSLGKP